MDCIKKFLRDESGTAEAASSGVMIGALSSGTYGSGLPGIWDSLINNPLAIILVGLGLVFMLWVVLRHELGIGARGPALTCKLRLLRNTSKNLFKTG
jgi:hypothetical protein